MNLENYISQLLYRYQCVTVPGFGAFLTENKSAQYQKKTNTFQAPTKSISFNVLLKNNDGLLANYISTTEKIAYEAAVNYIAFETESWLAKLQENNEFELKNIGEFYLNTEKNLIFKPVYKQNHLTDSFGLTDVVSPSVKRSLETTDLEITASASEIGVFEPESNSYPYLKYAAVLIITAGIAGFYGNNYYNNQLVQQRLAVETAVQKKIENKIQSATFFISNPVLKKVEISATLNSYHVVANAFVSEKNAKKYFKTLISRGFQSQILPKNEKGTYLVVFGSFNDIDAAEKLLLKVKSTENPESWILTKQL